MKLLMMFVLMGLSISSFYNHNSFKIPNNMNDAQPVIENNTIETSIGKIAYYQKKVEGTTPIIFLHGVYYDHNLWNYQTSRITDRTTITIDMPLHGKSKDIYKSSWSMTDCSDMLIEFLDQLNIEQCYAVGHSWGSMTILRTASQHPDKFKAVGLCNMPFKKGGLGAKIQFGLQHMMLGFRGFYTKQVANAMFSKVHQVQKPEIVEYLELSMNQLTNKDIRQTDKAVISNVDSGQPFLKNLSVPALALKGDQDYVQTPPNIETTIVEGKHTSPLEQPEAVMNMIRRLVEM